MVLKASNVITQEVKRVKQRYEFSKPVSSHEIPPPWVYFP